MDAVGRSNRIRDLESVQVLGDSATPGEESGWFSPRVRWLAEQLEVDPLRIKGTGRGGRVTARDLRRLEPTPVGASREWMSPAVRHALDASPVPVDLLIGTGADGRITLEDVRRVQSEVDVRSVQEATPSRRDAVHSLSTEEARFERVAPASSSSTSRTELPGVSAVIEVDVTRLATTLAGSFDASLSIASAIAPHIVRALRIHPRINTPAHTDPSSTTDTGRIDLAVERVVGSGPVRTAVHAADAIPAEQLVKLIQESTNENVMPLNIGNNRSEFTVLDVSPLAHLSMTSSATTRGSAQLTVGAPTKRPVAVAESAIAIRDMCWISLAYGPDVASWSEAVTFLEVLKKSIEAPSGAEAKDGQAL